MSHRIYDYKGTKKVTSIRLSDEEKESILTKFSCIQEFIQFYLQKLEKELKKGGK